MQLGRRPGNRAHSQSVEKYANRWIDLVDGSVRPIVGNHCQPNWCAACLQGRNGEGLFLEGCGFKSSILVVSERAEIESGCLDGVPHRWQGRSRVVDSQWLHEVAACQVSPQWIHLSDAARTTFGSLEDALDCKYLERDCNPSSCQCLGKFGQASCNCCRTRPSRTTHTNACRFESCATSAGSRLSHARNRCSIRRPSR